MAHKRRPQDPPPPAPAPSSSSTEDDLEESDNDAVEQEPNGVSHGVEYDYGKSDDDDEEEEDDDHHNITNTSALVSVSKASKRQSSSDSGDGSSEETDSDSDSDKSLPSPSVMDFTIKPVVSKPIKDAGKPNRNSAKNNSLKRPNESNTEEKESKKRNKVANGQDEDVKKDSGVQQRLWIEEDEVAILKGIIDYKYKTGNDPGTDMAMFLQFIKKSLHSDVSKIQLASKIRNLKKKFQRNTAKCENGEDPVFNKPLDQKIFELSKKVWGSAPTTNGVDKRKATPSKGKNSLASPASPASPSPKLEMELKKEEANGEMNAEPSKSGSHSSFLERVLLAEKLMLPESAMSIVKEATPLIGSSKVKDLERRLKKLQKEEFELFTRKVELVHITAKAILEAMESST